MARVLVIDDDVSTVELLRVVLDDAGFDAAAAAGAADLPPGPFDCIVTDLIGLMAYEDGGARDWILRLRGRFPDAPIVVVTAHVQATSAADPLPVRRVIMKPFDLDELLAAVREAMG